MKKSNHSSKDNQIFVKVLGFMILGIIAMIAGLFVICCRSFGAGVLIFLVGLLSAAYGDGLSKEIGL